MGDGANDLPMMGEAGLSVAYHAKPKVREQAMVAINEGGLDRLLEVLRPRRTAAVAAALATADQPRLPPSRGSRPASSGW